MSNPVCISPLKFYDSPAKQNHHKSYAYGHISPLITKTGWIPPFQFVIPTQDYKNGGNFGEAILFDAKTNEAVSGNLRQELINSGFSVETIDGYKIALYKSLIPVQNIPEGQYYLRISGGYEESSVLVYAAFIKVSVILGNTYTISVKDLAGTSANKSFYLAGLSNNYDVKEFYDASGNISGSFVGQTINNGATKTYEITPQNSEVAYVVLSRISSSFNEGDIELSAFNIGRLWTYYSEVFCFDNVTKDCLELEYWNETGNFAVKNGVIAFPADFHFKLLLKGEIGKPEYNFEEESTKRLGYIFVESQVSKKTYKFNAVVPEYICDALRIVRLCDNKIIRCKDDEYEAITFEMEAEWQTQGDLASVTCEFETDNVVANIGGFVPDKLGGDYNNDYNEDFDKE